MNNHSMGDEPTSPTSISGEKDEKHRLQKIEKKLALREKMLEDKERMILNWEKKINGIVEKSKQEVKLNVGGKSFVTSMDTLCKEQTFFSVLFSGQFNIEKNEVGEYFIDRNPKHFEVILDHMRGYERVDARIALMPNEERAELAEEVDFYQIDSMRQLLPEFFEIKLEYTYLLTASMDSKIKVWELEGMTPLREMEQKNYLRCIAKVTDNIFAAAGDEQIIQTWDFEKSTPLKTLIGHTATIYNLAVLSTERIASCSRDNTVKIWSITTGQCQYTLSSHTNVVFNICTLDTKRLAIASLDKTIKIWDYNDGKLLHTIEKAHSKALFCIFKVSNRQFASADSDGKIRVWSSDTYKLEYKLKGHTSKVWCMTLLRPNILVTGSADKTIRIWNLETRQCIQTIHESLSIFCLVRLSNDQFIAAGSKKSLKCWNIKPGNCPVVKNAHANSICQMIVI